MKKFVLVLMVMILNAGLSYGYYVTSYGNNMVRTENANPYGFGSNAAFLPKNTAKAAERMRQCEYEKQYLESLKNSQNINVNINTNGVIPYANPYSYGRRYYGNSVYTPNRIIRPGRTNYGTGMRSAVIRMF